MFKKWICQNKNWVFQNFPFLENDFDALTDYELFCKMVEYAKSLVISNDKFVSELKTNLERMYNEGKFDSFIEEIVNLQTTFTFNSVADMKSATNLVDGSFTRTSGYYSYNDGGGAYYKIRTKTNDDIIDEMFIIEIDENLVAELQFDKEINYLQVGGKVNDETYDSSITIQTLINKLYEKKAGKIYLPAENLYFQDTIILKSNVEIIGFGDYSIWNFNSNVWQDKITTLYYNGQTEKDLFITNIEDTSQLNYQPNIVLKNLYIVGNNNVSNGLNLIGITKSNIENITIIGCKNNIRITRGMTTNFKSIYSQIASEHCLLIDKVNGPNTTLYFYDCYFGQTRISNGNPLTIESDSLLNGNFINCVFESSNNSIEIDSKNDINFTNLYVENIPESRSNPTFKIGNTNPNNIDKGNLNFIGGCIMGSDANLTGDMCIFDINYISNFTLINTPLKRSNYSIKLNETNTGLITCVGVNETQITYGINYYKSTNKIAYFNCNNNSVPLNEKTFIPKMTLPRESLTLENNWIDYGAGCTYLKFGNFVILDFNATAGTVTSGTIITSLPTNILPVNQVYFSLFNLTDSTNPNVPIRISNTGKVVITDSGLTAGKVYSGTVIFLTN